VILLNGLGSPTNKLIAHWHLYPQSPIGILVVANELPSYTLHSGFPKSVDYEDGIKWEMGAYGSLEKILHLANYRDTQQFLKVYYDGFLKEWTSGIRISS
jgi:hypothetical protein